MTKKNMGRVSPLLLILLVLGVGFTTYNWVTMVMNNTTTIPNETGKGGAKFHVLLTATDTTYSMWQSRIMYYWYKRMKDQPQSDMGGFTRLLHSGLDDALMDEIPTVVVDYLPEGVDKGYVVLNRPWALVQWLKIANIEEEYILMTEPDYIFVKPLPNLAHGDIPAAFPYSYILPKKYEKVIRKYYPEELGPVTNVDPVGNSAVIMKKAMLEEIAPTWMNLSLRMKNDPETDHEFGWILEMYAYAVASALHGVRYILHKDLLIHPPLDKFINNGFMIHYTHGNDYTLKGKLTFENVGEWRFDKRTYYNVSPPKNLSLPPPNAPESVVTLIKMVNEATANIPDWNVKWD